jgi:RNA polymerase sigma-70 factor (ECF subfamily)
LKPPDHREGGLKGEEADNLPGDEELAVRAQNDDRWAIDQLIRRYYQKVLSITYAMSSGDREEAQDLTQEAFLKAFLKISTFRSESSFYTWFYRIIINTCLDGRRRRHRWDKIFSFMGSGKHKKDGWGPQDKDTEADPLKSASENAFREETEKALMALPQKQRLVFQLKAFHDLKIREIAEIMGVSQGTIKSHLFRATQFLRRELKGWIEA